MKYHSISVYQDRYATSIVADYLGTAIVNISTKLYNTTLSYDMIFINTDAYTSDEQIENFTGE